MKTLRSISVPVFLALVLAPAVSPAVVVTHLTGDEELLVLLPEENVAFVAEGRIGDLGGAGTFELDLGQSTGSPYTTSQYVWSNGASVPFSLTYEKTLNIAHYTLGSTTLQYSPHLLFMEIFVRGWALDPGTSVVLTNLSLNGESIPESCTAVGGDGLDILRIQGGTLLDGFTLSGQVTMQWSETPPTQSALDFQIKVGSTDPEVSTRKTSWGQIKERFR